MDSAQVPQMSKSTAKAVLGVLRKRLIDVNSDIIATRSRISETKWMGCQMEEQNGVLNNALQLILTNCKRHEVKLGEQIKNLDKRRHIIRLEMRKLSLLDKRTSIEDLPDEILRHVFGYVKVEIAPDLVFVPRPIGDIAQIQNIRFTCKRFNKTSSHLLMQYVKVEMTWESLCHLNRVTQHETISKGIRAIKVDLGRHYDPGIVNDIRAFAQYQGSRLRHCIHMWRMDNQHYNTTARDVYEGVIDKASLVASVCENVAANGWREHYPGHAFLKECQDKYRLGYYSQMTLQRGAFGQTIAYAMTQMPTATWLAFEDGKFAWSEYRSMFEAFAPLENSTATHLMHQRLEIPELTWFQARKLRLKSPPVDVIPKILLSVENAGIPLKGINLRICVPDNLSSLSPAQLDHPTLNASLQHLRSFTFLPGHGEAISLQTSRILDGFLSTILNTSTLESIDLNFGRYEVAGIPLPRFSMARILLRRTWPNLKELCFEGPFRFEDMQQVVNTIGRDVKLVWGGHLFNEQWSDLLDFLRSERPHKTYLNNANGSIAGRECEGLEMVELDFLFHDSIDAPLATRANRFIRRELEHNPILELVGRKFAMIAQDESGESGESGEPGE